MRGGQGWIPRSIQGKPAVERIQHPEVRLGSFWFRVLSQRGIKVRIGPSRRASSIKSEDDTYFRFECGEFLRASEVVTFFAEGQEPESFAKLYRNRHASLHNNQAVHRPIMSLASPAEWVQINADNYQYLQECSSDPYVQRHRDGWRYNVVREPGVQVRKGPSFSARETQVRLLPGESVLINERVTPAGERITWLRLKDGQGWAHDMGEDNEVVMIAHSLRHRSTGRSSKSGDTDIPYNAIIARLFQAERQLEEAEKDQEETVGVKDDVSS